MENKFHCTLSVIILLVGFYSGVCQKVHIHLKRTEIADIPDTTVEQRQWLFDSFRDKDKYLLY